MLSLLLVVLSLFSWPVSSAIVARGYSSPHVQQIYQYPAGTWLENLVVRSGGKVLATRFDEPVLVEFDPTSIGQAPKVVYTFPKAMALFGITKLEGHPHTFVVAAGNFSLKTGLTPKSFALWTVDFTDNNSPKFNQIPVPEASLINGITSLNADQGSILIADSGLGNIAKVNVKTGQYSVLVNSTLTQKLTPDALLGVNGIRKFGSFVYFTNGNFLAKFKIKADGTQASTPQIVGNSTNPEYEFDDFAIDQDGTAYVATGAANAITRITPDGKASIFAGSLNSSQIAEPTSLQFGQGWPKTLYVTTAGGLLIPVNGTTVVGAQLLSITL